MRDGGKGSEWGIALGFLVLSLAVYWPAVSGEFVFDDVPLVVENDELWQGAGFDLRIDRDRSSDPVRTNFRPLRFASYKLDVILTRLILRPAAGEERQQPFFFHLTNIVLHAINAFLVYLIARALARARARVGPLLLAAIFALHPVHSEAVAYVSGRRDVLFTAFYLLAIWLHLRHRNAQEVAVGRSAWRQGRHLLAVSVLQLCALASKEMAVSLVAAIPVVDVLRARLHGRPVPRDAWRVPVVLGGVACIYVTVLMVRGNPGLGTPYWGGSLVTAVLGFSRAVFLYLRLLLWPDTLTVDYSYAAFSPSTSWLEPWTGTAALIALIAGALGACALLRSKPLIGWGTILFLITLAPVSQLIPHPERVAERFLYLPSLALLLVGSGLWQTLSRRQPSLRPWGVGVLVVLLTAGVGRLRVRLDDWRSAHSLWRSATRVHPDCARAQFGLAAAAQRLRVAGRGDGEQLLREALAAADRAVGILARVPRRDRLQQGYYLQALTQRAGWRALSSLPEDLRRARADFEILLAERDTDGEELAGQPGLLNDYLGVLQRLGAVDRALEVAEELSTSERAPKSFRVQAALFLARVAAGRGLGEAADSALDLAGELADEDRLRARVAFERGELLLARREFQAARGEFQRAAATIGESGRWESARYREAECLEKLGDSAGARRILRELLERRPSHLPSLLSLAELSLAAGDLDEAEGLYTRVLANRPGDARAVDGQKRVLARRRMRAGAPSAPTSATRLQTYLALARRMLVEDKLDAAEEALRKADENAEGPEHRGQRLEIRELRGEVAARRGNWADAAEAYRQFLDRARLEERERVVLQLAEVIRQARGPAAAYEFLESEWNRGVRHPLLARNLGVLAVQRRAAPDAIRWYETYSRQENLSSAERERIAGVLARLRRLPSSPPPQPKSRARESARDKGLRDPGP